MAGVPAVEIGHPMTVFILVEGYDFDNEQRRVDLCFSEAQPTKPGINNANL